MADLKPDRLIIGGISNPEVGGWDGAVTRVIEQARHFRLLKQEPRAIPDTDSPRQNMPSV